MADRRSGRLRAWAARTAPAEQVNPLQAALHGPPGAPAVVLLHGQPGTGADWQWLAPLLEGDFTVVVPDRPGYGATGGPPTGFAGNAAAVAGLLDRLGADQAVVVGHSWGGGVALALATGWPERVAGLVLVSSVAPGEAVSWDDRLLAAPLVGELIAGATIGGVGLVLGSRRVQSLASHRLAGRARDGVVALTRLTGNRAPVWRSFVAEQRALLDELDGMAPGLAGITAPTVIVHGTADHIVAPDASERLQRAIPGARRHLLAGAGHLLPHDRPDDIAAAVREAAGEAASRREGPWSP